MDPHDPYFPHPYTGEGIARVETNTRIRRSRKHMRELYEGEIRFTDEHIGKVEAKLRELGLWDDTLIVITADHGEEFHEHGGWWHGTTLYEEQIHVPLLVKWPKGKVGAPARVDDHPVRHIDIVPTLLAQAGAPIPAAMQGRDLAVPMARAQRIRAHGLRRRGSRGQRAALDPHQHLEADRSQPGQSARPPDRGALRDRDGSEGDAERRRPERARDGGDAPARRSAATTGREPGRRGRRAGRS